MAWWEGMLIAELQKLPPAEIERILREAFETVGHERFMAAMRAVKHDARRRGLLKESQPA